MTTYELRAEKRRFKRERRWPFRLCLVAGTLIACFIMMQAFKAIAPVYNPIVVFSNELQGKNHRHYP
jgi:hypothetical protein